MGIEQSIFIYSLRSDLRDEKIPISHIELVMVLIFSAWYLKFIPAVVSDLFSFRGYHRKPYIIFAFILMIVCATLVACLHGSIASMEYHVLVALFNVGIVILNVVSEACFIEESRTETPDEAGKFRLYGMMSRALGSAIGDTCGPPLFAKVGTRGVYVTCAVIAGKGLLSALFFPDIRRDENAISNYHASSGRVRQQDLPGVQGVGVALGDDGADVEPEIRQKVNFSLLVSLVFQTLSHRDLRNLVFLNVFVNMFPGYGLAMFYYIVGPLGFSVNQVATLGLFSAMGRTLGIVIFYFIRHLDINFLHVLVAVLSAYIGLPSMLIAMRVDLNEGKSPPHVVTFAEANGIDNFLCSISEDVLGDIIDEIRYLAMAQVLQTVCKRSVEASVASVIESSLNFASAGKRGINAVFMSIFEIDHQDFRNLKGYIFTCMMFELVSGALFLRFIPSKTQYEISSDEESRRHKQAVQEIQSAFREPPRVRIEEEVQTSASSSITC